MDGEAIYQELSKYWEAVSIQRQIICREKLLVPIYEGYSTIGAMIFIAVLAYPNDKAKQVNFVKTVAARQLKISAPLGSSDRRILRKNPQASWAFDVKNKRIAQSISAVTRIIAKRNRAAWVLGQKLISNPDMNSQLPLRDIILRAANQNNKSYPAYYSEKLDQEDRDDMKVNSFRRQVMSEARPVIHLALAFHLRFEEGKQKEISLLDLIIEPDKWFKETIIAAEMFRVFFGDLFPRHDTQYKGSQRVQNYSAPMKETIAILPWIDPVRPNMDYKWFLRDSPKIQYRNTPSTN